MDDEAASESDHHHEGKTPITIRRRHVDPTELTPKQLERVLKNRQAAQASRERKRAYVTEVEESRDRLQEEANELLVRVNTLEREKTALHDQVNQLKSEFAELRALFLSRTSSSLPLELNDSTSAVPQEGRMSHRPTDHPAKSVLTSTTSPSIRFDHSFLGRRRLTVMPLSARPHRPTSSKARPLLLKQARSLAPLTLRLLMEKRMQNGSSVRHLVKHLPKTSSGSISIQHLTWQQKMILSNIMTKIISRYHFRF